MTRYGMALSHGSADTGYVFGITESRADVERTLIRYATSNRYGTVGALATEIDGAWYVQGKPVQEWCRSFSEPAQP